MPKEESQETGAGTGWRGLGTVEQVATSCNRDCKSEFPICAIRPSRLSLVGSEGEGCTMRTRKWDTPLSCNSSSAKRVLQHRIGSGPAARAQR
ncbi:hypothetical protein BGW80DRAFT_1341092 [Lactifluus volemus]|nr:hypothetical protein BGW80DRAFT_1341092 [Lactifluus volemus]